MFLFIIALLSTLIVITVYASYKIRQDMKTFKMLHEEPKKRHLKIVK